MKKTFSLLVLSAFVASILVGCSGISEEEAKNVDLKAKPVNPPAQGGGGTGAESKPGPGATSKPI